MKQRLLKFSIPRRPRQIRKALHSQGPKPIYPRFLCIRPLLAPVAFDNSLVAFGIFEPQNALRMSLHYTLRKTAARCLSSIPWLFSGLSSYMISNARQDIMSQISCLEGSRTGPYLKHGVSLVIDTRKSLPLACLTRKISYKRRPNFLRSPPPSFFSSAVLFSSPFCF